MLISLSLLKLFIPLDLPIQKICELLTLLGIEVDAVINEHPPFALVVVGEILSTKPHPNAEKLTIAEVNDGRSQLQVVCAAENCKAGIKTAFAKIGALITDSDGKQRKIEKANLRGVESQGMLCSASDLHIWDDSSGLLEVPREWENGQDLTTLLWDPVLELSLTPNLGHCLSALGVARELGAALQKELHIPKIILSENEKTKIEEKITAKVRNSDLCPRYMCRLIENVKIAPSPFWLQKELLSCGQKPIHNAVDIVNYIMIKRGQPLHAFDSDKLDGHSLEVAAAEKAQKFLGLDGVEREIAPGTLLISDAKKPVAIAGVLGSSDSAVNEQTKNILLEAAFFDPMTIRRGAKKMGIRTESALRFERGIDPNGVEEALDEAAHWIATTCKGQIAQGKVDLKQNSFPPKPIHCRIERVNRLLGTQLSQTEIEEIFHRLGFKTRSLEKETFRVEVPQYRFDISEEIDLVEEVARIYGYNNIETTFSSAIHSQIPNDPVYLFETELRQRCVGLGLQEFLTSDLISPKLASLAIEVAGLQVSLLKATHAKTEEYSILRPSLLPGLLQAAKNNLDRKNQTFSAFEIGQIHFLQKEQNIELPMAALMVTGKSAPSHWSTKYDDVDFYDLKGLLEMLFEGLKIEIFFQPSQHLSFHPGRQANVHCENLVIGSFGEIHPSILAQLDIKQRILYAELNLTDLMKFRRVYTQMSPLSQFPSSERDWTVSLPFEMLIKSVFNSIQAVWPSLLEKIELIDLYHPEHTAQKNATFRFTYRDPLKTISYEEVEAEHTKLMKEVSKLLAK